MKINHILDERDSVFLTELTEGDAFYVKGFSSAQEIYIVLASGNESVSGVYSTLCLSAQGIHFYRFYADRVQDLKVVQIEIENIDFLIKN